MSCRAVAVVGLSAVVLAACGGDEAAPDTVPIPSKIVLSYVTGDRDSQFLEEAYAQAWENPNGVNLRVSRLNSLATNDAAFQALLAGTLDMVPMYSQDLLTIVKALPPGTKAVTEQPLDTTVDATFESTPGTTADSTPATTPATTSGTTSGTTAGTTPPVNVDNPRTPDEQISAINTLLPEGLTLGAPSSGERKPSIACTAETVEANSLTTLSAMAAAAPAIVLGAPAGFDTAEPLGAATLKSAYGWAFKSVSTMAGDDAVKAAVKDKTAGCFALDSDSPLVATLGLKIVTDDRYVVPANVVVPVYSLDIDPLAMMVGEQVTNLMTPSNLSAVYGVMGSGVGPHSAAKSFLETAQPDPEPATAGSTPFDTTVDTVPDTVPATLPATVPATVPGTSTATSGTGG